MGCRGPDLACLDAAHGERLRVSIADRAPEVAHPQRAEWLTAFARAQCAFEVDAFLLLAMAEQESGLDPAARGPAGGVGLLQVRAATAEATAEELGLPWSGEESLLDPATNVAPGAAYLAEMKRDFGTWEAALAAYNLGPARLRDLVQEGKPATSPYAREILARKREFDAAP
jgi:soluble lytic murein transglycosylase-like protein